MSEKNSEFNIFVDGLASNVKTPEQIIDKRLLGILIEETQGLLENMNANPHKFENWHKQVVKNNIRGLKLIQQGLGYE